MTDNIIPEYVTSIDPDYPIVPGVWRISIRNKNGSMHEKIYQIIKTIPAKQIMDLHNMDGVLIKAIRVR